MVPAFPFDPSPLPSSPLPLFLVSETYNRKEREDSAKRRKATQRKKSCHSVSHLRALWSYVFRALELFMFEC